MVGSLYRAGNNEECGPKFLGVIEHAESLVGPVRRRVARLKMEDRGELRQYGLWFEDSKLGQKSTGKVFFFRIDKRKGIGKGQTAGKSFFKKKIWAIGFLAQASMTDDKEE